jgi:hypothetical protein
MIDKQENHQRVVELLPVRTNGNGSRSRRDSSREVRDGAKSPDKRPALRALQLAPSITSRKEVDFKHLDDGRVIELVEDPADKTKTKFAVFDSGEVHLADAVDYGGQLFVPMARETHGLEDIMLPRAPQAYGSVEELFWRTSDLIAACVSLPPLHLCVTSAFVLNSWFADRLQSPAYLMVTGLPQSGKTTLLDTMRLLCRRPLSVSDITSAAAYDACTRFSSTLLIDEIDWRADQNSRAFRKQLRAGTSKGMLARNIWKTQHAFGAKALSSVELPDDAALMSRSIHVPMNETDRGDLKKPWDPEIATVADGVRGQLLQLRLERYPSISPRIIRGAEKLRPRSRDLLSSLLAPLEGDEIAEQMLLEFFVGIHDPSAPDLLSPAQTAVVAALFEFAHIYPDLPDLLIGEVAKRANKKLASARERLQLSPRKTSELLAILGFDYRKRSSRGSLLELDRAAVAKIHKLKRDRKVEWPVSLTLVGQMDRCDFCRQEKA